MLMVERKLGLNLSGENTPYAISSPYLLGSTGQSTIVLGAIKDYIIQTLMQREQYFLPTETMHVSILHLKMWVITTLILMNLI